MELISNYSYEELCNILMGKLVNLKSDCQIFPNFDVTGKVTNIVISKNKEYIIKLLCNGKVYDIGSHMHNLRFSLLL